MLTQDTVYCGEQQAKRVLAVCRTFLQLRQTFAGAAFTDRWEFSSEN